ncbi:hypothetical protein [Litorivivens sp.]|uniref:hypothetical protein n=1 Tax=Litorivivens sp. TaxID=2020868 RepID=UPI0035617EE8
MSLKMRTVVALFLGGLLSAQVIAQVDDACPEYVETMIAELKSTDATAEFKKAKKKGDLRFIPTPSVHPEGFNINGLPDGKYWPDYKGSGIREDFLDPSKVFYSCQIELIEVFDQFAKQYNSLVAAELEQ